MGIGEGGAPRGSRFIAIVVERRNAMKVRIMPGDGADDLFAYRGRQARPRRHADVSKVCLLSPVSTRTFMAFLRSTTMAMKREPLGAPPSPIAIFVSAACLLLLLLLSFPGPPLVAGGRPRLLERKPDPSDAAATARWLAAQNSWGVLSTLSIDLAGAPFGNVVSFSDGLPGEGHGIPYFYLTTLDPTARDALKDERSSFTLSEFPIGSCGETDPENPTCAKLTLTGKLKLVDSNSTEGKFALSALFAKHAEMRDWPKGHDFQIFKLDIQNIFLIDWFGGAKPLTLDQYLKPIRSVLS